jgi:7-cyano-7-deazaguanine reductase
MNVSDYEGKQNHIPELKTPPLEHFSNVYPGKDYLIHFEISEFTAICPKTGLPDFGTIFIDYIPNDKCIELKSLKEYINFFRNIGIFHENVVNKISEDIIKDIKPKYLKVFGDFKIRGGIKTKVELEFKE